MYKTKERREFIKVVQGNIALRNNGLLRRVKIGLSHYFFLRKKPGETKSDEIFPNIGGYSFVEAYS